MYLVPGKPLGLAENALTCIGDQNFQKNNNDNNSSKLSCHEDYVISTHNQKLNLFCGAMRTFGSIKPNLVLTRWDDLNSTEQGFFVSSIPLN